MQQQDDKGNDDSVLNIPQRKKHDKKVRKESAKSETPQEKRPLQIGDYVKIPSSSLPGKIIAINGKMAQVALGALRTNIELDRLAPAKAPKNQPVTPTVSVSTTDDSRRRQLDFKNEIDVRGMRTDEALQAVTYFLDDALQFQIPRVRILHGTGTGALRMAIRQYLQASPTVKSFHDEDVRLGGAGITVVNLS